MRVVFMGTPEFAVSMLTAIHQSKHVLAGVVTTPDRPSGRGRKLKASAVKEKALELGLPILQPEKLRDPHFLEELQSWQADVFVVVAFRMLPANVWKMPSLGTFNLHASLLPQYRGAAPINWAIVNGETKTGLSTFFIDEKIDTGAIIDQTELSIGINETAGSLHDRMMVQGAKLVVKTINSIANGQAKARKQEPPAIIKEAPKIFKPDLLIDPQNDALKIHNLIRGMSPFPGAYAQIIIPSFEGQVKILETRICEDSSDRDAGSLYKKGKRLFLSTGHGDLEILSLQLQGKKRLNALDFLNGQEINEKSKIY